MVVILLLLPFSPYRKLFISRLSVHPTRDIIVASQIQQLYFLLVRNKIVFSLPLAVYESGKIYSSIIIILNTLVDSFESCIFMILEYEATCALGIT